jgi:hypothetical protein
MSGGLLPPPTGRHGVAIKNRGTFTFVFDIFSRKWHYLISEEPSYDNMMLTGDVEEMLLSKFMLVLSIVFEIKS